MAKKAKKKAKTRKRLTPLEKIRKELTKLEALHAKEETIVEKINEIIEDGEFEDAGYDFDKWEGTNGD
jgi:hypothetical protein